MNEDVLVVDGFSKAHAMTGWRLGFAHGPSRLIQEMAKLQQFSFVCRPSIVQYAGVAALDEDLADHVDAYRRKRDAVVAALSKVFRTGGSRRGFLRLPTRPGEPRPNLSPPRLLTICSSSPATSSVSRDTHFRISYAVDDATLQRGLDVLRLMAENPPPAAR